MKAILLLGFFLAGPLNIELARAEQTFAHVVPELSTKQADNQIELTIPIQELVRARVLVASPNGYRSIEMAKRGKNFVVKVKYGEYSVLKYQFQVQDGIGHVHESKLFELAEPIDDSLDVQIKDTSAQLDLVRAKKRQYESAIVGLSNTDPATLSARKNEEMGKAFLLLGQKEREIKDLKESLGKETGEEP